MATGQVKESKPTPPIVVLRNQLDARIAEIKTALPAHMSPERFIRVVVTAVQLNPELLACDRQSLWNSCMRCANDGLLPDNRDAALVPFKNKVQYLPMYGGLLRKFRNSGEFKWITAGIVYEGDEYEHVITETGEHFRHVPSDDHTNRKIKRVYALATTKEGGSFIADLSVADINKRKAMSRTTREDSPWKSWPEEMMKKTAIRVLSKLLPMSSDLDVLMRRDEEAVLGVESVDDTREAITERQDTKSVLDQFAGYPTRESAPQITAHEWPEDGMPIPVKKDEPSAPDDFPGDEPQLRPGEVEAATGREAPLQRERPAAKPENAEQYRAYYEAKRAAASDDLSQAQLLRGWFHGDAERRLRSKCQVPIEDINDMKQDLEDHLRALSESPHHDE